MCSSEPTGTAAVIVSLRVSVLGCERARGSRSVSYSSRGEEKSVSSSDQLISAASSGTDIKRKKEIIRLHNG